MKYQLTSQSICILALITSPLAAYASSQNDHSIPGATTQESTTASEKESQASGSLDNEDRPRVQPLSVAPLDHVQFPSERPDWIVPTVKIDSEEATIVLVSGPSLSKDESRDELKEMTRAAIKTYAARLVKADPLSEFDPGLRDDEIAEMVVRQYEGTVQIGESELYEHAVELKLSDRYHDRFLRAWNERKVAKRLSALSALTIGGLTALIGSSMFLGLVTRRRRSA